MLRHLLARFSPSLYPHPPLLCVDTVHCDGMHTFNEILCRVPRAAVSHWVRTQMSHGTWDHFAENVTFDSAAEPAEAGPA